MTGTFVADVIGWAGAVGLLLAYAALSSGRLRVGPVYHLLNLGGAAGLALNGAVHRAWPSTALNVVWLAIGIAALRRTGSRARAADSGPTDHPA